MTFAKPSAGAILCKAKGLSPPPGPPPSGGSEAFSRTVVFGSSQATVMSVIRLAKTIKRANTATAAWTTGKSELKMDSTTRLATPGQAKIVSVITAPPRSIPNWKPRMVTTGIRAFRRACRKSTVRSPQALGPRGADVILGKDLDHPRPGQAHENGEQGDRDPRRGEDDVLEAPGPGGRQQPQFYREDDDQHDVQPEQGHGLPQDGKDGGGMVRMRFRRTAAKTPSGMEMMMASRSPEAASQRVMGMRSRTRLRAGPLGDEGLAEISPNHARQEFDVLHDEGPVQAHLPPQEFPPPPLLLPGEEG